MPWMARWAGGFPLFVARAAGARFVDVDGHEVRRLLPRRHRRDDRPRARPPRSPRSRAQLDRGLTFMLPTEDALAVVGRARAPLRPAVLAARHQRHRRQPVRDPPRPPDHRPAEDPGLQLVLPRHGRRDVRDPRPSGPAVVAATRQPRPAGRSGADHPGGRVERRRGARARARRTATSPASSPSRR